MKMIKLMIMATLAILLSGCVGMLDRIPIMGENEDGTKTIVAYASRTRFYTFSKASEEIELWKVSSDKGVEMTGSKANSDSTKMVDAFIKGLELGGAYMGVRSGGSAVGAEEIQSRSASAAPELGVPSARIEKRSLISGEGGAEIVIIGNRDSCPLCRSLWSKLDIEALSASAGDASIIDADATANKSEYNARRPKGSFTFPWIRVYVGGAVVDEFSARGMSQAQISARASKAIGTL